jgi:glycine/D-amino acid oxidase-like deaminating enzyme
MKFHVVGAGIFGCVVAVDLAKRGHCVKLFEKNPSIMSETSWVNQYRIHRGFHYPRSTKTIYECITASLIFEERFRSAVFRESNNLYGIADKGSKTSFANYLSILDSAGLDYRCIPTPDFLGNIEGILISNENLFDPYKLKHLLMKEIREHNVNLQLNTNYDEVNENYDKLVLCTYGYNQALLERFGLGEPVNKRIQIVEKPIIKLPDRYQNLSLVIMDGEFFSCDPIGDTGKTVLGHVKHAVHKQKYGKKIELDYLDYLNTLKKEQKTKFVEFRNAISGFMPIIKEAEHITSMYSIRVVPGDVALTDERPSNFVAHTDRIGSIFSGKIPTSVMMLKQLIEKWPEI